MSDNFTIHHRKSIRLQGYDYSQNGAYYLTVCSYKRQCIFGKIINDDYDTKRCERTELGKIIEKCWYEIPIHYPFVKLDAFIVMPNHMHGVIFIERSDSPTIVGANN